MPRSPGSTAPLHPAQAALQESLGSGEYFLTGEETPQVVGQLPGCLIAIAGQFLEALEYHTIQVAWQFRAHAAEWTGTIVHQLLHGVEDGSTLERGPTGEHFIQDGAQGKNVGRRADRFHVATGLLGRHVTRR